MLIDPYQLLRTFIGRVQKNIILTEFTNRKPNFCLYRFFFLNIPPPHLSPSYPHIVIIVFKFLCRQVFECLDVS